MVKKMQKESAQNENRPENRRYDVRETFGQNGKGKRKRKLT